MISVAQALQGLTAVIPSSQVQLSRTALIAASFPPDSDSSVQLSAGRTATPGFQLYTSTGTLSISANEGTDISAPNPETAVESPLLSNSSPPAPPAIAPATSASPAIPLTAGNSEAAAAPLATSTVNALATNVFVNTATNALADFTANPVHGNLATALYINAATYRARQVSSATLVSAIDLPGPVASLDAISVDIADLNDQSSGRQNQSPRTLSSGA